MSEEFIDFDLPQVNEFQIEVDGQSHLGSWYVIMGQVIVNYNGHTVSTRKEDFDPESDASRMLHDLVRNHFVSLDEIPSSLPPLIRNSAHSVLNNFDDEQLKRDLVSSFGECTLGSETHRQLSWLCVNGISVIVPAWKHMCDDDAPERTYRELRGWLEDSNQSVNWARAETSCVPLRHGEEIVDCDICRVEPIALATARTATFLRTGDSLAAMDALLAIASAYDEGCHPEDCKDHFEKWLVFNLLPSAIACRSMT